MSTTAVKSDPAASVAPDAALRDSLDAAIEQLRAGVTGFAHLGLDERAALLHELHGTIGDAATTWVTTARLVKRLEPASPLVGEEWMSGPYALLTAVAALEASVRALSTGTSPLDGKRFGRAPGGRATVRALPGSPLEALLFHGFTADVWMPPGVPARTARQQAGLGQRTPGVPGGVGLVLGAGNVTSIPPLDVLSELFAHNRVALLKLNPVMDAMLPVFETALAPLIRRNLLRIVAGDGAVGSYLVQHPGIEHVHITGSAATHDLIVYGLGAEGRANKAANTPILSKPITSELGGVSPIIVVPGVWSPADLVFQAEHVVTQRLHNGGYNCIAGQVIVLSPDWPQRDAFLAAIRDVLDRAPARPAWYPGSDGRVESAADTYPTAERHASGRLLVQLPAGADARSLLTTEYFAPVLGVIEVPGAGLEFVQRAVDTVNRDLSGTLGANIIIDPATKRRLGTRFVEAVAELHYGAIAINAWTAVGYLSAAAPWGAFPGHTVDDVQSGIGVVHNALLIDGPERTVINGPFRPFPRSIAGGELALFPKPPWFVTARSAARTGERLVHFAKRPSLFRMVGVFAAAFRA